MVGIKPRAIGFWRRVKTSVSGFFRRIGEGLLRMPRNFRLILSFSVLIIALLLLVLLIVGFTRCAATQAGLQETPVPEMPTETAVPVPAETPVVQVTPVPLQRGDQKAEVTVLQERLMDLGYLDIDEPTNYFGSATQYAVKLFQRQHDLEQDGVVGTATHEQLFSEGAQHYLMKVGAEGRDIKALQQQLYEMGYMKKADIDSIFGEKTTEAVKAFQKRNNLKQDGLAGEKTIAKLYSADARISSSLQKQLDDEAKKEKEREKQKNKNKNNNSSGSSTSSSAAAKIDKMIDAAKAQVGKEYILGDTGPNSYDCSGLVHYSLRAAGYKGHRLNAQGYANNSSWQKISKLSDVKKGDLLFFTTPGKSGVTHVGIYIGNGTMIDASSGVGEVVRRSCMTNYWKANFVCARRPFK